MSYSTAILALSPTRYYKFGESSGTVATDSSSHNVAGTYGAASGGSWTGGTLGTTGANTDSSAATFNGISGYVEVNSAIPANGATKFSWVGWIKPRVGGSFLDLHSRYDSNATRFEFQLGSTGAYGDDLGLVVTTGGTNGATASALVLDDWQLVAVVFDGTQSTAADRVKVYVNDDEEALGSLSGPWPTSIQTITAAAIIGARSGGGNYWDGAMQGVALFDGVALSGATIAALYAAGDSAGAPAEILTATVDESGAKITVVFDTSTVISAATCTVTVDGYPLGVSEVSGTGDTWHLIMGLRWILAGSVVAVSHDGDTPVTATNDSEVVRAQAKHVGRQFGMFVHWGYETYAGIEWSNGTESINTFSPTASVSAGIDQWIAGAIAAGMRYIVLVAKHHGGFCLWPSADSTRTIAQTTWYSGAGSPDIVDLFVTKCRAAGLGVGLYFSIWDRWWEAAHSGFSGAAYIAHCQAQLTELLTNYGAIDLIWMDGWGWGTSDGVSYTTIPFAGIYDHIKGLQPDCLAIVNDHQDTLASSDLLIYEVHITGGPASGNLFVSESCETIRADFKWFWSSASDVGLSAATINGTLATMTARRSGYLLNCPPALDVLLPAETIQRLADVGAMKVDEWSDPIGEATGGSSVVRSAMNGNFLG